MTLPQTSGSRAENDQSRFANMVFIQGGEYLMGNDGKSDGFPSDGESPIHRVRVNSFYMDRTEVTNAQFSEFVKATHYRTEAERFGWAFVLGSFVKPEAEKYIMQSAPEVPWWVAVEGACWHRPEGPYSTITERMDHPVIQVSWNDAVAYCAWAGKRLPTEAEWEYAARGGREQTRFPWGNELAPGGKHFANTFQGKFPVKNIALDGFEGIAPVASFPANGYGLYDMIGNVSEWCADWFCNTYYSESPVDNPKGPETGIMRIIRGGSFLCTKSYCNRFRCAARNHNTPESCGSNVGFRCVADA